MMTDPARPKRRWWKWLLALAVLVLLPGMLLLDKAPHTPVAQSPGTREVSDARAAFDRLPLAAQTGVSTQVAINWREASSLATLIGRTAGIDRIALRRAGKDIALQASKPWMFGLWFNLTARIAPSTGGFPPIDAKIGRLTIPQFVVRWTAQLVRARANLREASLPPLDRLVQSVSISPLGIEARLVVPPSIGSLNAINPVAPVDMDAATSIFCSLSAIEARVPARTLTTLVNRAFAGSPGEEALNRARFVALAMMIVPPDADRLVWERTAGMKACAGKRPIVTLLGRNDLALHWTLSAALSASLGANVTREIGAWKEIADSAQGGSGFSFVDLSADRSGVRFGQRATAPRTAAETARQLSRIAEEQLLPLNALTLSEGLSEEEFKARFVSTESGAYDRMIARIDRVLDRQR